MFIFICTMLKSFFSEEVVVEAGCDEAGRGCLAGPVVAAAVIMPRDFQHEVLTDSKMLSREQRVDLREIILEQAIDYAIGVVDNEEIDRINILNASFLAMHQALEQLKNIPELLLIDGNRFKAYKNIRHQCIIQGDGIYFSIAAASILAKTHRDEIMRNYALQYPGYFWETNVGYATKAHRKAIQELGITPLHRKSFTLIPVQLDLFNEAN